MLFFKLPAFLQKVNWLVAIELLFGVSELVTLVVMYLTLTDLPASLRFWAWLYLPLGMIGAMVCGHIIDKSLGPYRELCKLTGISEKDGALMSEMQIKGLARQILLTLAREVTEAEKWATELKEDHYGAGGWVVRNERNRFNHVFNQLSVGLYPLVERSKGTGPFFRN